MKHASPIGPDLVIDSDRDTDGAIDMINAAIGQYRDFYKSMSLDVK